MSISATETSLRLAFVYNFTKFIQWPESRSAINLCVVGDQSGLQKELQSYRSTLAAKQAKTVVKLTVLHFPKLDSSIPLKQCQMLYLVSSSTLSSLPDVLPPGVVLVVNEPQVSDLRVSFSLIKTTDNRMGFLVNSAALKDAQVIVSSQLLTVAKNHQGDKKK
ncbi:MAG: YfiR family protein [Cellvibrio sp.]|nr:YfiR family protein [Cellvibrio sp.]